MAAITDSASTAESIVLMIVLLEMSNLAIARSSPCKNSTADAV